MTVPACVTDPVIGIMSGHTTLSRSERMTGERFASGPSSMSRKQNHETVLEKLADLSLMHGPPKYLRSDNGAEFTAIAVRKWLQRLDVETEAGRVRHRRSLSPLRRKRSPRKSRSETGTGNAACSARPARLVLHRLRQNPRKPYGKPALVLLPVEIGRTAWRWGESGANRSRPLDAAIAPRRPPRELAGFRETGLE